MQFQCARCDSKYQISDEKVQGKTVKVRCKSCGAMIVVKGQRLLNKSLSPRLQETSLRTTAQVPSATTPWYVSLQRSKHGPISESEVIDLLENGSLNARSYAWTSGMSDWQRIGTIPQFNRAAVASDTGTNPTQPTSLDAILGKSASETTGDSSSVPAIDDTIVMHSQEYVSTAGDLEKAESTPDAVEAELEVKAEETTRRYESSNILTDDADVTSSLKTTAETNAPQESLTTNATDEIGTQSVRSQGATAPEIVPDVSASDAAVDGPEQTTTGHEVRGKLTTIPGDGDSIAEATPPPIPTVARQGSAKTPTDEPAASLETADRSARRVGEMAYDKRDNTECTDGQDENTSGTARSSDEDNRNKQKQNARTRLTETNVDDKKVISTSLAPENGSDSSVPKQSAQMIDAGTQDITQQEKHSDIAGEAAIDVRVINEGENTIGDAADIAVEDEFDDADDSFFSEGDLQASAADESELFPTAGKLVDLGDLIPEEAVEPSRDEAKQLAQEFSLMIQLNKNKNRNRTVFALFAALITAGIAALLVIQEEQLEEKRRIAAERRANAVEYVPPNDEEQPTYAVVNTREEIEPGGERQEARTFAVEVAIDPADNTKRSARSRSRRKKSKERSEKTTTHVDPLSGPSVVSRSFGKSEAGIALKAGGATKAPGEAVTDEAISRLISRRMKKFTQCKRRNSMEAMKVRLKFAIQASGVVTDVKVTVVGGEDKYMQGCVRNLASKWRFPPQPTSKTFNRTLLL